LAAIGLTFLAYWLLMLAAPTIPLSRSLRALLVEAPITRVARLSRGDVAVGLILATAACLVVFVGERDGLQVTMMGAPDIAIWLTSFEVSAYLDVAIGLISAASSLRIRGLPARLAAVLRRGRPVGANRRAIRVRKPDAPSGANDDDHRRGVALAA
jgi:hypothetical protein